MDLEILLLFQYYYYSSTLEYILKIDVECTTYWTVSELFWEPSEQEKSLVSFLEGVFCVFTASNEWYEAKCNEFQLFEAFPLLETSYF